MDQHRASEQVELKDGVQQRLVVRCEVGAKICRLLRVLVGESKDLRSRVLIN
jgi:hypothetical protein